MKYFKIHFQSDKLDLPDQTQAMPYCWKFSNIADSHILRDISVVLITHF